MENQKYGRLTIVKEAPADKYYHKRVFAQCDCGTEKIMLLNDLLSGRSRSCGCLALETRRKHTKSSFRIYKIWLGIVQRTSNPNYTHYPYYGGRGITLCDEWRDFKNFYRDMQEGYRDDLTIDRVDNNKGYCKENCRWTDKTVQMLNSRKSLDAKGYYFSNQKKKYCAQLVTYRKKHHLGFFNTAEEARQAYLKAKELVYANI